MFSVFIMVFSLLSILSASFAYQMPYLQMLLIALACCVIQRLLFSNKKRFLLFLGMLIVAAVAGGIYTEYNQLWEVVRGNLGDFFMTYIYSVELEDYYIGVFHQRALMVIIGLIAAEIYAILYHYRYTFFIPLAGHLVILFLANKADLLTSYYDFGAFFIYLVGVFAYLFDFFVGDYLKLPKGALKRSAIILTAVFGMSVALAGLSLHSFYENPFVEQSKGSQSGTTYDLIEADTDYEIAVKRQMRSQDYTLQTNFDYEGVEVFVVNTDKVDRLYSQTFATYDNGQWVNPEALESALGYEGEALEIEQEVLDSENIFHKESIQVSYRRLQTNMLLRPEIIQDLYLLNEDTDTNAELDEDNASTSESHSFLVEPDGSYELFEAENDEDVYVGYGFMYTLTAYLPKYGTEAFEQYMSDISAEDDGGNDDFQAIFTEVPEDIEPIRELTQSIVPSGASRMEAANVVRDYLKENYTYDEEPDLPEGGEQIQAFLFDTQAGFCQQFATSMALMLRSIGIPTRFVVGYSINNQLPEDLPEALIYGPEAGLDEDIHVYDRNAHTWVQVFYPGYGWIDYEPTPGIAVTEFVDPTKLDLETEYDVEPTTVNASAVSLNLLLYIIAAVIVLLISMVLMVLVRRRLYKSPQQQMKSLHQSTIMYLEAYGIERRPAETLREYSLRVDHLMRIQGNPYHSLIAPMEEVFYNEETPSEELLKDMNDYLMEIKPMVKRMMTTFAYRRIVIKELISRLHKK